VLMAHNYRLTGSCYLGNNSEQASLLWKD
jgi:hypothetical protein